MPQQPGSSGPSVLAYSTNQSTGPTAADPHVSSAPVDLGFSLASKNPLNTLILVDPSAKNQTKPVFKIAVSPYFLYYGDITHDHNS